MSLSQEPAFSTLKNNFVCGYRDISNESYAGLSGRHDATGNAVNTTNGAGPHNLQLFMLSADGTVLECLPGYWNPQDLVDEMAFANQLNQVYLNPRISKGQKDQTFRSMQLAHSRVHSPGMVKRSKMQGFDQKYEAQNRLYNSDTIAHPNMISADMLQPGGRLPQEAFKTTDQIMHERMANRPFVPINQFDVANYVEYGRPKYDKHEDARMADGTVNKELAKSLPTIGNKPVMAQDGRRNKRRRQQMQAMNGENGMNGTNGMNGNYTANGMGNYSNNGGYSQVGNGNSYNSVRNY